MRYFALLNTEKRHIDRWPTLILAILIAWPYLVFPEVKFFSDGGLLDKLILLTSALSAFYVAALVAAATFEHPDLDKPITVGPIKLRSRDPDGEITEDPLTRREFTTTVFGYLAFNAVLLSVACAIVIPVADAPFSEWQHIPWIGVAFTPANLVYWRDIMLGAFSVAIAHLVVVTLLGLYYLMGRLYRREPRVVTKKSNRDAA